MNGPVFRRTLALFFVLLFSWLLAPLLALFLFLVSLPLTPFLDPTEAPPAWLRITGILLAPFEYVFQLCLFWTQFALRPMAICRESGEVCSPIYGYWVLILLIGWAFMVRVYALLTESSSFRNAAAGVVPAAMGLAALVYGALILFGFGFQFEFGGYVGL